MRKKIRLLSLIAIIIVVERMVLKWISQIQKGIERKGVLRPVTYGGRNSRLLIVSRSALRSFGGYPVA